MARFEGVDQLGPVILRCRERVLIEGGSERRGDDRAVLLADAGERVAHEMNAAALDGRSEYVGRGSLQALVIVGNDQTGTAQAAVGERAKKLVPEDLCLAGLDGDPRQGPRPISVALPAHSASVLAPLPMLLPLKAWRFEPIKQHCRGHYVGFRPIPAVRNEARANDHEWISVPPARRTISTRYQSIATSHFRTPGRIPILHSNHTVRRKE